MFAFALLSVALVLELLPAGLAVLGRLSPDVLFESILASGSAVLLLPATGAVLLLFPAKATLVGDSELPSGVSGLLLTIFIAEFLEDEAWVLAERLGRPFASDLLPVSVPLGVVPCPLPPVLPVALDWYERCTEPAFILSAASTTLLVGPVSLDRLCFDCFLFSITAWVDP